MILFLHFEHGHVESCASYQGLLDFVAITPSFADGATEAHKRAETYSKSYKEFKAESYGSESHDILIIIKQPEGNFGPLIELAQLNVWESGRKQEV